MIKVQFTKRWKSGRLATIFFENVTKNTNLDSTNALQFRYGEIQPKPVFDLTDDLKDTYRKYTLVRPNDIMLNGLNLNYDFVTQRVARVKTDGIITSAYICLRPREGVSTQYYTYLLKTLDSMKVFNGMGTGIRLTLSFNLLKGLNLPIPPRDEQDQIVRYLNWQVSKINKLIAIKKKQIEILNEREKKIMVSILLNGSNNDYSLIRGEHIKAFLPTDWRAVNLGRLLNKIEQGWSPNAGEELKSREQWHVLTLSAVKHGKYQKEAKKPIDIAAKIPQYLELRNGDLLLTRSNTRNLVGDVCIVEDVEPQTIFSDLIYRLTINKTLVMPRYIMFYLLSALARYQIECTAKGSSGTMPKLAHSDIKTIRVILPPLEEQNAIIQRIDKLTKDTKIYIDKIQYGIDTLHEFRGRLISDVVTGQIDVRNVVIPEYELVKDNTIEFAYDEFGISEVEQP